MHTYEHTPLFRADAVLCAFGFECDGDRLVLGYGPSRRAAKRKALDRIHDAYMFFPSRFSRCYGEIELDTAHAFEGEDPAPRVHRWLTEEVDAYGASLPTVAEVGVW